MNHLFSLSSDTIAVKDANDNKIIHFIDAQNGKLLNEANNSFKHKLDVIFIALNYHGNSNERICSFIDKNSDVYLTLVRSSHSSVFTRIKLTTLVRNLIWNDDANILVTIQETNKLNFWIYPFIAFVDRDIMSFAVIEKNLSENNKNLQLINFSDNRLNIRCSNGSSIYTSINPFVNLLHTYTSHNQWKEALKLCQFLKDSYDRHSLWATLAGMSLYGRQLEIAEIAYSEINKIDKVFYIQKIQNLKDKNSKNCEIALIRGNINEAKNIMIQNGFIFRAILLELELHKWENAIELSKKYNHKYDSFILGYRKNYLDHFKKDEHLKSYLKLFDEVKDYLFNKFNNIFQSSYIRSNLWIGKLFKI